MPLIRPESNDSLLIEACQQGVITPVITKEIEQELISVITSPRLGITDQEETARAIAARYLNHCLKLTPETPLQSVPQCRDPNDQKFLDLAYQVRAYALVTQDQDLLTIADQTEIDIISKGQFLARLHEHWNLP